MKKKLLCLILIVTMLFCISACQAKPTMQSEEPMIMFIGGGSLEDGSFNSSITEGLKKAEKELKYDLKILEAEDETSFEKKLKAAIDAKPNMIISGPDMKDLMLAASADHGDINFVVVDSFMDKDKAEKLPENFKLIVFNNEEGAFLMGALAASGNPESNIFGFIKGMDSLSAKEAEIGYKAGIKSVSPHAQVLVSNVGDFNNAEKAAELADEQRNAGVRAVFGFAGGSNKGIIENAAQNGYWFIGVDKDQALEYPSFAASILCSMVKNLDVAIYQVVKSQIESNFKGGVEQFGVGNGGITLGSGGGNITPELQALYDSQQKAISSGAIKVPKTEAELEAFGVVGSE